LREYNKNNKNILQSSVTALSLGTPASFLAQLDIKQSMQLVRQPTSFTLTNPLGEDINVVSDNFTVESDGTLVVDEINITDVLPICDLHNHEKSTLLQKTDKTVLASAASPHIGSYQGEDVSRLESKPARLTWFY
jgi:hypothetical protein